MKLAESTAIVTGSGSGIGRAIGVELASHGTQVVCCGRRQDYLDETVSMIESAGGSGTAVMTDITQPDQVRRLVDAALDRFANIDILFNNAGSFASIAGVHEVDTELWWQDVTVNLYGSLLLIRHVLPHMMQRDHGIIINMNGGRPTGGSGYACGKAGLMELTRLTVEELKTTDSSVMVFSAGPGLVRTEMTELQVNSEAGRKWIPSTAQSFESGQLAQPEDIARATAKLVQLAKPSWSGKGYNPRTDFSQF